MDEKALKVLEYPKILAQLSAKTVFAISREMAETALPQLQREAAIKLIEATSEARNLLLEETQFGIGSARDNREALIAAKRGKSLTTADLLDIRSTLVAARTLERRFASEEGEFPYLSQVALVFEVPEGLVDAISKAISNRGEILDSASPELGRIRSQLGVVHDRLLTRMQKFLTSAAFSKHLQEAIVTQRDGRYVLPIKADAKSRVKAVVHDKSSSGATLFVEPLQVVELNNEWRELQLAERDEELRILLELSAWVKKDKQIIDRTLEGLGNFDLILARGRLSIDMNAKPLALNPFTGRKDRTHPGIGIKLLGARHPLLDSLDVVPLDIELDDGNYCLVITGPNTGGKTVTLKTVGLFALMAQSGLHVPVEAGSEMTFFENIFADIGDEQSIEQSLSTFSGHITNIIDILDRADEKSLVIIDELGAGTDPLEGAALANAILDFFVRAQVTTLVATHYSELKVYAHGTPGVVNASVEFDLKTLAPTYHLTIGLPGRSNALAIAKRLGLKAEVIDLAKQSLAPSELQAEDLLDEIHRERDRSREARKRTETIQHDLAQKQRDLSERLESLEDERLTILEKARKESQAELESLRDEIGKLRKRLAKAEKPLTAVAKISSEVLDLEAKVEAAPQRKKRAEAAPVRAIRLGDQVRVRSLNRSGIVTALGKNEVEVQIGALRAKARFGEIELLSEEEIRAQDEGQVEPITIMPNIDSPGAEISLRGQRAEEALNNLERYLDRANAAGLPFARIVHGKGTGVLRKLVREELRKRSFIDRYEEAQPHEGGEGVTIAFFLD